ncbi:hypothetical protein ACFY2J_35190 [Streptomyces collinus]|uniref:hypothetical protein n=1 Tax=Streptomyces collinus TaxID=42684 RepID=UPI0036945624
MRQPHLSGSVGRRLLVNRRVVPEAAARLLPWPPRPQVVRADTCLPRLGDVRPVWAPKALGPRTDTRHVEAGRAGPPRPSSSTPRAASRPGAATLDRAPVMRNAPMGRRLPPGPPGVPHNAAPANSGR